MHHGPPGLFCFYTVDLIWRAVCHGTGAATTTKTFYDDGYHACHAREPVEPPNDARSPAAAFLDKMVTSAWMAAARPMATRQAMYVNLTPIMFSLGVGVWCRAGSAPPGSDDW